MDEKEITISCLTETWLQSNTSLESKLNDLADEHCIDIIIRNRQDYARNGRQYGGVALTFRRSKCSFKEFELVNPDNYEVLAAVGKVHGIKEKVFVIATYLPPNLALTRARACLEYLSDCIAEAKRVYEDCLIIVAGDFNQWPAEEIVEAHPEFKEVVHGPTRGNRSIDRTFCNFSRSVTESSTPIH